MGSGGQGHGAELLGQCGLHVSPTVRLANDRHQIVPQPVFEARYLQPAYDPSQTIHAHKLAVVYLVMAIGVMFDLQRGTFDSRAANLFALSQACLDLVGLENATLSTVRALCLCGTYVLNDNRESTSILAGQSLTAVSDGGGAEVFWPILGLAIKVAYGVSLACLYGRH
jgi:hypothetical protein